MSSEDDRRVTPITRETALENLAGLDLVTVPAGMPTRIA
jgi:hypothetical protein